MIKTVSLDSLFCVFKYRPIYYIYSGVESENVKYIRGDTAMTTENNRVLEEKVAHLKDIVDKQGGEIDKIKDEVNDLKQNTGEMKVYITQIFSMLDDIKLQLNTLSQQGITNSQKSDNQWLDFFQRIFFLILGGLVAYFFAKSR